MESLTYHELLKVLKLARKESLRDHMTLLTTYSHAMRAREVVDLRIDTILNRRVKGSKQTRQPWFRIVASLCSTKCAG
jgi:integrase